MAKTFTSGLPSVSTGDVYQATAHNNIVTTLNSHTVPPSCQVRRTSNLSYTAGSNIAWEGISSGWDTDPTMWTASDPTKITLNTAGVYLVTLFSSWSATATLTLVSVEIKMSGNAVTASYLPLYNGTNAYGSAVAVVNASAGAYLQASVTIVGGSNYVLQGAASGYYMSHMTAQWLGKTS